LNKKPRSFVILILKVIILQSMSNNVTKIRVKGVVYDIKDNLYNELGYNTDGSVTQATITNTIQSLLLNRNDEDIKNRFIHGIFPTPIDGKVSEQTVQESTNRSYYITSDFVSGDVFIITGAGGVTGKLVAKAKDDIIIYAEGNSSLSTIEVYCDGTFDTLIFNSRTADLNIIHKSYRPYKDIITEELQNIKASISGNIDIDFKDDFANNVGMIQTNVGDRLSEITPDTSKTTRRYLIVTDFSIGDVFIITGQGGSTGKLYAKVKNDIIIEIGSSTSSEIVTETIECDGSFDTLIFNSLWTSLSKALWKRTSNPIEYTNSKITEVNDKIESLKHSLPTSGKTMIVFGDSSTATGNTKWAQRLAEELEIDTFRNYANGGATWRNKYQDQTLTNCLGAQINSFESENIEPDIIIIQLGGNDISNTEDIGTASDAFSTYNYKELESATTTYACMRYYLEYLKRQYPTAYIVVGTVFQRLGNMNGESAKRVNDVIIDVCKRMCIQIIDGERYCGFSPFTEPCQPYYNDGNPGVANDRTNLSRTNPIYNFIKDSTGQISTYEEATNNGVLNNGYSKRYGLYTYDGKHQSQAGEDKVFKFYLSEMKRLIV